MRQQPAKAQRIAVIGRGLIGSAAARHLALSGNDVMLIGPPEPENKSTHTGVFGSHYDEGRITRRLATDTFWAQVCAASIERYATITAQSGIAFFSPVGAMMVGPTNSAFVQDARSVRDQLQIPARELDTAALAADLPFFRFPSGTTGFYEPDGAGHISPRRLVAAQTAAAVQHGARLVPEAVTDVHESNAGVTIDCSTARYAADVALICTGAMTDHLAPRPLNQKVYARTVALFEVSKAEADRLAKMPSVVLRLPDAPTEEPYLLPPIRYPDGATYLKLGGDPRDVQLHTSAEIAEWFRSGGEASVRDHLTARIATIMPDLKVRRVQMDACVTTFTPSGRPVIDWLGPRIATASGGNGAGAKCSDELGRLAAELVTGGPDPLLAATALPGVGRDVHGVARQEYR